MTASPKAVVHVTIERFFESIGSRKLDDLMWLNDQLDQTLARHATGWQRPSADEAVLATDPPWDENGSPMDWASALSDSVRDEIGLDCSVGIAATRFAARICSRIARPRGVLLWLSGYEDGLIASLPLEELDELTPKQLAMLRAQGVRTLGEMSSLASVEARAILGSQASKLMSLIRGLDRTADRGEGSRLSLSWRGVLPDVSRVVIVEPVASSFAWFSTTEWIEKGTRFFRVRWRSSRNWTERPNDC